MNSEQVLVVDAGIEVGRAKLNAALDFQRNEQAIPVPFKITKEDGSAPTPEQLQEATGVLAQAMEQAEANGVTIDPRVVKNVGIYESQQAWKYRKILLNRTPEGETSIKTNITASRCGHRVNIQKAPTSNCVDCWNSYFNVHPGVVAAAKSVLETLGERALRQAHGRKFVIQVKRLLGLGTTA